MIGKGKKQAGRRQLESTTEFLWGRLEEAGYHKLAIDDTALHDTSLTFYKHLPMYFTHLILPRAREDRYTHFTEKEIKSSGHCGLVNYQVGAGTQNS